MDGSFQCRLSVTDDSVLVCDYVFGPQISDECVNDECVFVDPINTMYYIVVTMTTVGYGDQVSLVHACLGAVACIHERT